MLGECPATTTEDIIRACINAQNSWPQWRDHAAPRRARLLRLADVIGGARDRIISLLVDDAGKNHADAAAEADLLVKKITLSLDAGLARTPQKVNLADEPQCVWRARGVAAVLGPFNFPLHLLHGLIIPALAVGCTVVAKPSERCPSVGVLYEQLIAQAGLSDVCHIIHGDSHAAHTLITQPAISTVAAVGGIRMGHALATTLASRPDVVLALELGGVNPAIVLEDADFTAASIAIAEGAWRMAGQRCTATRHVHVPRAHVSTMINALTTERARWMPDGTPNGASGALINHAALSSLIELTQRLPLGLRLIAGDPQRRFANSNCIEPLLAVVENPNVRNSSTYREEHFGPLLIVDPYDDLSDCLNRAANNPYRLAASVFTASRQRFTDLAPLLPYGQLNHNRPTAGARSDMPFGGLGAAGNGHPAAIAAGAIFADESVVW